MKEPITPLSEIEARIETFWIVNCEHRRWILRLIGHTAVIYKDLKTGKLYVYESTSMSKSGFKGVQITPLRKWIDEYPGKVKLKPVTIIYDKDRAEAFKSARQHINKHLGKPYTDPRKRQGRWTLIRAAWDSRILKKISTNIDTEKWFFCTMLVMNLFRYCRLTYERLNCAEWEPDDTRDEPRGRLSQVLCSYVSVEKEIRVK